MKAELMVAGITCFVLALGHAAVGRFWVLRDVENADLHRTPFGPPSMTLAMLHFTWYVVTVLVLALGVVLVILALAPDADPQRVLLRGFAAAWLTATVMAAWSGRRTLQSVVRLPAPVGFLLVAVMCWTASNG